MKKNSEGSASALTPKEKVVIKLAKLNFSCKEIAQKLGVTVNTVRKHRQNIRVKINCVGRPAFREFIREFDLNRSD